MRGLLLDRQGRVEGETSAPSCLETVDDWLADVEREQYHRRNNQLLDQAARSPHIRGTTTTNRYLSYPAAATGISKTTSGGAAWSFSTYVEVVPVNTITATYYIAAIAFHPPNATAPNTINEFIIELATGLAGSEVLIIQIPVTVRNITAVGYVPPAWIDLSEPKQVAANTRISMRVAYSVATTAVTLQGFKIMYETV